MKWIKIIAKTEKGREAILKHVHESNKAFFLTRKLRKEVGFLQEIISEQPMTLEVTARTNTILSRTKCSHAMELIDEAMKLNGADIHIDYTYEWEE